MEESKAAAYYDELSRKGEGAARFKQGLGFSSTSSAAFPTRVEDYGRNEVQSFCAKFVDNLAYEHKKVVLCIVYSNCCIQHLYFVSMGIKYSDDEVRTIRNHIIFGSSPEKGANMYLNKKQSQILEMPLIPIIISFLSYQMLDDGELRYIFYELDVWGCIMDQLVLSCFFFEQSAAERVKAKMKLQLSETAKKDATKGSGWERFEFDKDAPLDDEEIEAVEDDTALVKRIGQSFRFSAVETRREEHIKAAHDEAMFGASSIPPSVTTEDEIDQENKKDECSESAPATSLLSDTIIAKQQGSWRDRARKV
ncbi:hypothetical protein RHSIM_Rhsim12G0161000 [Rhododendron simsii]|uniref:Uncharacterized protein n=1 Tax=Rhododendron simsii TaxID=118357 RepID=A0A834L8D4_RHOSS|nr:hypothetical protein RHSIM_Rhsim12G0161000 [Rhododendron simsii]